MVNSYFMKKQGEIPLIPLLIIFGKTIIWEPMFIYSVFSPSLLFFLFNWRHVLNSRDTIIWAFPKQELKDSMLFQSKTVPVPSHWLPACGFSSWYYNSLWFLSFIRATQNDLLEWSSLYFLGKDASVTVNKAVFSRVWSKSPWKMDLCTIYFCRINVRTKQ